MLAPDRQHVEQEMGRLAGPARPSPYKEVGPGRTPMESAWQREQFAGLDDMT